MVRTVNEEPCFDCHRITNYYDPNMGRLCPQCTGKRCANFGKGLTLQHQYPLNPLIILQPFVYPEDMKYLADENKHLLTDSLIDHSNDIDAHFHKKP